MGPLIQTVHGPQEKEKKDRIQTSGFLILFMWWYKNCKTVFGGSYLVSPPSQSKLLDKLQCILGKPVESISSCICVVNIHAEMSWLCPWVSAV